MLHLEICSMHRHRDWILKTEEPAERGESALKEVKWHYKDNPIRLWKMFLTKSETQWSVMGVLWLIKAFPWNNQSLSFSLIFPLSLNHALSLSLLLSHTHMEGFRCHQSHLDLCMRSSANCGSMWEYPATFYEFQWPTSQRSSSEIIRKCHIYPLQQLSQDWTVQLVSSWVQAEFVSSV